MGKVELDKAVKLSQGYLIAKMLVSNDIGNIPKEIDSLALQELSVLAKNNLNTVGEALVRHDKTLCDLWGTDSVKPLVAVTMEKMYDNTKIETVPPFKAYFYSVMQEKPKEVIIRSVMDMERHIGANPFPMFLPNEMEHCKVWFSATDSASNDFVNCNINDVPLHGNVIVTGSPAKCFDTDHNLKKFSNEQDRMRYLYGAGPIPYQLEKTIRNYMEKALVKNKARNQFKPKWMEFPVSRVFIAKETEQWTLFNCPKNSVYNGEQFCISNKLIKLDEKNFKEVILRLRNDYDIEFRNKMGVEYSKSVYQLQDMFEQIRPYKSMGIRDNDGTVIRHGDVVRDITTGEPWIAVVVKDETKVVSAYTFDEKPLDADNSLEFRKESPYSKNDALRAELEKNGLKKNISILNRRFPAKKKKQVKDKENTETMNRV